MWRKLLPIMFIAYLISCVIVAHPVEDKLIDNNEILLPSPIKLSHPINPAAELMGKQAEYILHYDGPVYWVFGTYGWPSLTGIRLTPDELAPLAGGEIIAVLFYHGLGHDSVEVIIYGEGTDTTPGDILYSEVVHGLEDWNWYRVDISTPVAVTGAEDIWVTVRQWHDDGQYPFGMDGALEEGWSSYPGKSFWFSWDGTAWDDIAGGAWGDWWAVHNASIRAVVSVGNVVLEEDFESGEWPPDGWICYVNGDPESPGWQQLVRPYPWTAHFDPIDDYAAWHNDDDYNCDDWLVSPQITIPAGATFKFYETNYYMGWYEYHGVCISTGSGDPADGDFVELMECDEDVDDWTEREVDISDYYDSTVYIAFRYQGYWATEWYIDNIFVGTEAPGPMYDVRAFAIVGIPDMNVVGDEITPGLVIENLTGNEDAGKCYMWIPDLGYWSDVMVDIGPYEVDTVSFAPLVLDTAGVFDVFGWIEFTRDMVTDNNEVAGELYVGQEVEDFETTDGGYTAEPPVEAWEWGIPTHGPDTVYSGVNCWGTKLNDDYDGNADWKLDSRQYVAGEGDVWLRFYHWYDIEGYFDGGNVKISVNGEPWQIVEPEEGYPEDAVSTANAGIPGEPAFSGTSNGWQLASFNLTPYLESGDVFKIRWHFGSDGSVHYPGWYIDDVMLVGLAPIAPYDLSVTGTANILDGATLPVGVTQNIGGIIENPNIPDGGPVDLRIFCRIVRDVDGAIVFNKHKDISDFPMGVDTIWFNDWTPVEPGGYTINIVVNVEEGVDPNLMNNMLAVNVTVGAKLGEQEVTRFFLHGPTPNPAAGTSVIEFGLPKATRVEFRLVDIAGRTVREVNETMASGVHTIRLDNLATGVYFYHFSAGSEVRYGKFVIVQ